jgi:hypothetical protein
MPRDRPAQFGYPERERIAELVGIERALGRLAHERRRGRAGLADFEMDRAPFRAVAAASRAAAARITSMTMNGATSARRAVLCAISWTR